MKIRHLVWLRRTLQGIFLLFFIYLVIESRLPQDVYIDYSLAFSAQEDLRLNRPVTFFFQLDPLVGLSSLLSGYTLVKGFLWAAGILVLTVLLGRVFCGFICPFGTVHHAVGAFKPALKGSRMLQANRKVPSQRVKYCLLILLLVAAVFGLNAAGFHQLAQIGAVHEFHHEIVLTIDLAEIEDRHNVLMAQFRHSAGLAREPLREIRIGSNCRWQDLHGHQSVEFRLPRLVHGAHPAFSHQLQDFELRKLRGQVLRFGGHEVRRCRSGRLQIGCGVVDRIAAQTSL